MCLLGTVMQRMQDTSLYSKTQCGRRGGLRGGR